jgi:Asp/Glu/hydantoin racemase
MLVRDVAQELTSWEQAEPGAPGPVPTLPGAWADQRGELPEAGGAVASTTIVHVSHSSGAGSSANDSGTRTLAFIHTVLSLTSTFSKLADELAPDVATFHIVDESLLRVTRETGRLTSRTKRRVLGYAHSAVEAGADAVLVTCSSIGPAVDAARPFVEVPVLRVDEPMADEAVRRGQRIGVLATLATTLEPTVDLVHDRARKAGSHVKVVARLCEGAFDAAAAGDAARHDELVGRALRELSEQVDVVVLAQASMARVADALPERDRPVPVLSSPRLGMTRAVQVLARPPAAGS